MRDNLTVIGVIEDAMAGVLLHLRVEYCCQELCISVSCIVFALLIINIITFGTEDRVFETVGNQLHFFLYVLAFFRVHNDVFVI